MLFSLVGGYSLILTMESNETGDIVAVILGCDPPVLLRESASNPGEFTLIGECFVYGLHDARALLGPLPPHWEVQIHSSYGSRFIYQFRNTKTGELTIEDPRLRAEDLGDWERILDREPRASDPDIYDYFRNNKTGEVINSDPRMSEANLRKRGVQFTSFTLV